MHILYIPIEVFNNITSYLLAEDSYNLLVSHKIICIKLLNNGLTMLRDTNNLISVNRIKYLPHGLTSLYLGSNVLITNEGLNNLPRTLTLLDLPRNKLITDEGLKYLPNV